MSAILEGGWLVPLVFAVAALAVAAAGGWATVTDSWYRALHVPDWKPPDWAFGPIWTVIFVLTTLSGVIAWNGDGNPASRTLVLWAFAVNGLLNIAWSVLFFRLRRPDWALIEVVVLWLSILTLIAAVGRVSLAAIVLNLPYLVWVSLAAYLNLRIVQLNPRLREA